MDGNSFLSPLHHSQLQFPAEKPTEETSGLFSIVYIRVHSFKKVMISKRVV